MALPSPVNPRTTFPGPQQTVGITSATTTTVKASPGVLVRIIVNKAVAAGTYTLYDGTAAAGTKIATVTLPNPLLANQFVLEYGVACSTSITVVTSAADDLTVVYN